MKTPPKKAYLDKLASELCRLRGHCEAEDKCRSNKKESSSAARRLTWAHIISRKYLLTRWSLDNCFCLCWGCHWYYTNHPLEWEEFVISKIGENKLMELKRRARENKKPDYELIAYELKQYKNLEGGDMDEKNKQNKQ
jgi:hypothetical protein